MNDVLKFIKENVLCTRPPGKVEQLEIYGNKKHFFGMTLEIRDEDVTTISDMKI